MPEQPLAPRRPAIVLDTNAVLDAWLFRNACMATAAAALCRQELLWIATPSMRQELVHTLAAPALQRWQPDVPALLGFFDDHAVLCAEPERTPFRALWCTDGDDQVFIDLALTCGARWLLTKDRALLRLSRKARTLGLLVIPPARWTLMEEAT
jgi:predicted nucleic acid-binding protein